MKKSFLFLLVAVVFLSCEDNETLLTAMQANLNDVFFKTNGVIGEANNTDQMITITGTSDFEEFTLHTQWRGENEYPVGGNEVNFATFTTADNLIYTTRTAGSSGTITITNQDEVSQELEGEFDFTFITATDTLNVRNGVFYAVSYEITD